MQEGTLLYFNSHFTKQKSQIFLRKRGGSVDNLLDELGEDGTHHQHLNSEVKKKSISSKNLSLGPLEEVKVTTV